MTKSYVIALVAIGLVGLEGMAIADKAANADHAYSFATPFLIKDFQISSEALVLKNARDNKYFKSTNVEELPPLITQEIVDTLRAQGIYASRYESANRQENNIVIAGTIDLLPAKVADAKVIVNYRIYWSDEHDVNIIKSTLKLKKLSYEVLLLKRLPRKLARELKFSEPIIERAIKDRHR